MRVFLDTALLVLALANTLIDPVDAMPTHAPKRHLLKRATNGFHKTALRHSAGLAHDLRIALRGLGVASPVRVSVTNGSSAAYCVSVPNASKPKSNTNTTTASSGRSSPTSTTKGPSSVTSTSTPSSTAQSDWRLAESYVRLNFYFCVPPARNFFFFHWYLTLRIGFVIWFRSLETRFSRDGTSSLVVTPPMGSCSMWTRGLRCVWYLLLSQVPTSHDLPILSIAI